MATRSELRHLPYSAARREPTTRLGLFRKNLAQDLLRNRFVYLMLSPVVAYYLIFHYGPMYGAIIAFKDFSPAQGILGSPWIGLQNFQDFFGSVYLIRLLRNTLAMNLLDVVFGFPAPVILALLLNELSSQRFKRMVQTITYLPHFMSLVVVVGILIDFLARDGLINNLLAGTGVQPTSFMQQSNWYWTLYVGSGIWQAVGWGSIIFLASIATVDPTLYEAAVMDGASRFRQMWHITLPGIMPMVVTLLILRIGMMMSIGYEKTLLMYNPSTFETADVISSYVYRKGVLGMDYSFSAAGGFVQLSHQFRVPDRRQPPGSPYGPDQPLVSPWQLETCANLTASVRSTSST